MQAKSFAFAPMLHPILNKPKSILYYFLAWIPTIGIHYFFLMNKTADLGCIWIQSVTYSVTFAILGLSMWWIIANNRIDNADHWSFYLSHTVAGAIVIFMWIVLSETIIGILCGKPIILFERHYIAEHVAAGVFYYVIISLLFYLFLTIKEKQERAMAEERMTRLAKESELRALKSQINPHFLFNSLNSANFLTGYDPKSAGEMLVKLADYLRFSLKKGEREQVTLKNELENCKRYLELEHYRFGDKLRQEWSLEEKAQECMVPVMLLQPLFENAVKHGVYESIDPVAIKTKTAINGDVLLIEVSNEFDPDAIPRKGEGVGLKIVADRLRLLYGKPNLLATYKGHNTYKAVVTIPLNSKTINR